MEELGVSGRAVARVCALDPAAVSRIKTGAVEATPDQEYLIRRSLAKTAQARAARKHAADMLRAEREPLILRGSDADLLSPVRRRVAPEQVIG